MTRDYADYRRFKGWDALFAPTPRQALLFETEFGRFFGGGGGYLIDVGFGSGAFLEWARRRGASVAGTEIQPDLMLAAADRGIRAAPNLCGFESHCADIVTAFDVLEHLPISGIDELLAQVARVLKTGGTFIARFPNCQSPAGLIDQFGDATHVTMLSAPIVSHCLSCAGFVDIVSAEALNDGDVGLTVFETAANFLKRKARRVTRLAYRLAFGSGNALLSANVLVVATSPAHANESDEQGAGQVN
jgi:SAM-dependent methyltransferase